MNWRIISLAVAVAALGAAVMGADPAPLPRAGVRPGAGPAVIQKRVPLRNPALVLDGGNNFKQTVGPQDIADPELRAVVDRVAGTMKLAMAKAAANIGDAKAYPLARDAKLESLFQEKLAKLPRDRQARVVSRMGGLLKGGDAEKRAAFGELATVDVKSPQSATALAATVPLKAKVTRANLEALAGKHGGLAIKPTAARKVPRIMVEDTTTVPVYRYWSPEHKKHCMTSDFNALALGKGPWNFDGIIGRVYAKKVTGSVAWESFLSEASGDCFYPVNPDFAKLKNEKYKHTGTVGYLLPADAKDGLPIYQYYHWNNHDHYYMTGKDDAGMAGKGYAPDKDAPVLAGRLMAHDPDKAEYLPANRLEFVLNSLTCHKDTSEWGKDEIVMGGAATTATGTVFALQRWDAGSFGEHGENFCSPPWSWAAFDLNEGGDHWPKVFTVSAILCEKDHGGFSEFQQKLLEAIRDELKKYIKDALVDAYGLVGYAAALVVNELVDRIYKEIIAWYQDDVFPPATVTLTVAGPNVAWGDQRVPGELWFNGHGGKYHLIYSWRAYKK